MGAGARAACTIEEQPRSRTGGQGQVFVGRQSEPRLFNTRNLGEYRPVRQRQLKCEGCEDIFGIKSKPRRPSE
jgi:hypothetical protein